MNLSKEEQARFCRLAKRIVDDPVYQKLKTFVQHGSVTTYEHSLRVARCAFWLNLRLCVRADEKELVTACLLHDFYLYDWHTKGDKLHGYHHPQIAAQYAQQYFSVSERESSAIRTHMWPLTLFHVPRSRTAWLLTTADKLCSVEETVRSRTLPPLFSGRGGAVRQ